MRLALVLLLVPRLVAAQEFDFHARGPYRPEVPRPEAVLGYGVGTRQTMYDRQQQVFDTMIAAARDRARTEVIGRTWEGREMRLLIISAPENLARLERIRSNLAALADPTRTSAAQARALVEETPVTVLLSHSVHGNEPAGFEAALQTAYQLLASEEPATLAVLRNVVVLINPSQNPDGHERFAAWSNSVAVGTDEPAAVEQTEPWSVWGRYNHYRFDLNRDLLALSQPESRALNGVFMRWRPQVVCDLHSTTSAYFFPPVAPARNLNLPPKTYEWFERFGRSNGAAFDAYGWQYFVRDVFDFFYPGYIDTWPSLRGGVGMTYETDGGPELRKRKDDGTFITFAQAIAHHYIASLATLDYAAAHRSERLQDFYEFHVSGMAEVARRPFRRVVFGPGPEPSRARWLAERLRLEGISVVRLTQPLALVRARSYLGGSGVRRTAPAGSYVVDLSQPESRLATAILEPRAVFDSDFVADQYARYRRNQRRGSGDDREGYDFYDITGWSLPLTLGLDAWWTDEAGAVVGEPVGEQLEAGPPPPAEARSAYLFLDQSDAEVRLAIGLLAEGFKVGVATRGLVVDGRAWPRGTFVVRVQRNPTSLQGRIAALARESGATVVAAASAFPDTGHAGTGSESVQALKPLRLLLAAGDGVNQSVFGSLWFHLEQELHAPVVPINLRSLARVRLEDYNALVIPDGYAQTMWRELGEDGAARLRAWVRSGAAVVGIGSAARLLARRELELTTVTMAGDSSAWADTTMAPGPGPILVSPGAPAGNRPEYVPGVVLRATLDRSHWLTLGIEGDQLPVFFSDSTFFRPSLQGANPVAFTGSDLTLAGFTWPGNTDRFLRGSVWASVESVGAGRVILFADDPVYRGFVRGSARLLSNALLLGPRR